MACCGLWHNLPWAQDAEDDVTYEAKEGPKWELYESMRIAAGAEMVVWVLPCWLLCLVVHSVLNLTFEETLRTTVPPLCICALLPWIKTKNLQNKRTVGTLVQGIITVWAIPWRTYTCLAMTSGILQHRAFIVSWIPMGMMFGLVCYVSDTVWYGVTCPTLIGSWILFNAATGHSHTIPVGATIVVVISLARHQWNLDGWKRFLSAEHAKKERQVLRETQAHLRRVLAAQHGMLRSIFDASCICDAEARVTFASEQMNDMILGLLAPGGRNGLTGQLFPELAASKAEFVRLSEFLANASQTASQQAQILHTTLAASVPKGTVNIEAKLFCIVLPGRPTEICDTGPDEAGVTQPREDLWALQGLFVGLQEVSRSLTAERQREAEQDSSEGQQEAGEEEEGEGLQEPPPLVTVLRESAWLRDDAMSSVGSLASWKSSEVSQVSSEFQELWVGRRGCRHAVTFSSILKCPRNGGVLMSLGSQKHLEGQCVPCRFMLAPGGCRDGVLCWDCHFPHPEAGRSARRNRKRNDIKTKRTFFEQGGAWKHLGIQASDSVIVKNTFLELADGEEAGDHVAGRCLSDSEV